MQSLHSFSSNQTFHSFFFFLMDENISFTIDYHVHAMLYQFIKKDYVNFFFLKYIHIGLQLHLGVN